MDSESSKNEESLTSQRPKTVFAYLKKGVLSCRFPRDNLRRRKPCGVDRNGEKRAMLAS